MKLIKLILAICVIGWVASFFNGANQLKGDPHTASAQPEKHAAPKVDFNKELETAGNTLVCPIDIVFDRREGHGVAVALDTATAVFGRSEKIAAIGCEDWREGIRVELSDAERTRGSEIQSGHKCGFLESQGVLIYSCAIRNAPLPLSQASNVAKISPSFDCNKASTYVESMMCADNELAEQDMRLVGEYRRILANLPQESAHDFKQKQAAWRAQVRDRCTDVDCIRETQAARIVDLSGR